ncbi:MAG: sulfatase [Planctomycetota bacterium]
MTRTRSRVSGSAIFCAVMLSMGACAVPARGETSTSPPNVVLIFADDLGYGDLSCYGHPTIHTPALDALAASGMKATQFYTAAPLCSPSRAALLTGCYPKRVGMHRHVVFPQDDHGLHPAEETIADLLRARGYATAAVGKWHLGHKRGLMPTDQGFDTFFGVPYSNDMAQSHRKPGTDYRYRLPLMRDEVVIEWEPDQRLLTRRYTDAALEFLEANRERPFFLYLPHTMPHIPIYASADFAGRSPRGLYGDVIEEIDGSVGEIVAALERLGLRENTLVIFTSDNGPWLQFGLNGGSAGLLRGGKGTNWEGGQRVPFLASWPKMVPRASVLREVTSAMDLLPTIARLCGADLPQKPIDGRDVSAAWLGSRRITESATSPPFLYYAARGELAGIRRGPWKLLLTEGELYHVERDVSEKFDRAAEEPALVAELRELALSLDAAIGAGARPVQKVAELLFDPSVVR